MSEEKKWDGIPENPEQDGWHLLRNTKPFSGVTPVFWKAGSGWVWFAVAVWPSRDTALRYEYLGPCFKASEVEEKLDASRREALEEAARVADVEKNRLWTLQKELPACPDDIVSGNRTERIRDAIAARAGTAAEIAAALRALAKKEEKNTS